MTLDSASKDQIDRSSAPGTICKIKTLGHYLTALKCAGNRAN